MIVHVLSEHKVEHSLRIISKYTIHNHLIILQQVKNRLNSLVNLVEVAVVDHLGAVDYLVDQQEALD